MQLVIYFKFKGVLLPVSADHIQRSRQDWRRERRRRILDCWERMVPLSAADTGRKWLWILRWLHHRSQLAHLCVPGILWASLCNSGRRLRTDHRALGICSCCWDERQRWSIAVSRRIKIHPTCDMSLDRLCLVQRASQCAHRAPGRMHRVYGVDGCCSYLYIDHLSRVLEVWDFVPSSAQRILRSAAADIYFFVQGKKGRICKYKLIISTYIKK